VKIEENPPTPGEENPGIEFASHPVTLLTAFIVRTPLCYYFFCSHPYPSWMRFLLMRGRMRRSGMPLSIGLSTIS
jgi:hypothetical protein